MWNPSPWSSSPPRVACWFDHVALLPLGPDRRSCQIGRDSSVTQERLKREKEKGLPSASSEHVLQLRTTEWPTSHGQEEKKVLEVFSHFDREGCFKFQQASVARRVPLGSNTQNVREHGCFPICLVLFFLGAIDCVSRALLGKPGLFLSVLWDGGEKKKK